MHYATEIYSELSHLLHKRRVMVKRHKLEYHGVDGTKANRTSLAQKIELRHKHKSELDALNFQIESIKAGAV